MLLSLVAVLVAGLGTTTAVLLTGRNSTPAARPLTSDEADELAVVRFQDYRRGTLSISAVLPAATGDVRLRGLMDFRDGRGSLLLSTAHRTDIDSAGIVQFNQRAVVFHAGRNSSLAAPLPTQGWQAVTLLTNGTNPLHTLLALILGLGSDRPDNSELLRQQGTRWLRTDHVDGSPVTVFSGPSGLAAQGSAAPPVSASPTGGTENGGDGPRTQYWVDHNGLLRRFEARIGSDVRYAVVDLGVEPEKTPAFTPALPSAD